MLFFQGFANSRIVREFPPFSYKVRIATLIEISLSVIPARGFESKPSTPVEGDLLAGFKVYPRRGFSF